MPPQIKLEKLVDFLAKELDFRIEPSTKVQIKDQLFLWKELAEKSLKELEISGEISVFFKENLENLANFDEKSLNFQRDLNNETDVSSGNAENIVESVKTMSTSSSFDFYDEKTYKFKISPMISGPLKKKTRIKNFVRKTLNSFINSSLNSSKIKTICSIITRIWRISIKIKGK